MIADILRFILLSIAALIVVPPVLAIFLPIIAVYFIVLLIFKLITVIIPYGAIVDIYNEIEENLYKNTKDGNVLKKDLV